LICSLFAATAVSGADLKAHERGTDTVIIEADRLDVNATQSTAVFKGNVRAARGTMSLRADTVTLVYDKQTRKVDTLSASGKVSITWDDRRAECLRLVYHVQDQLMELIGDVTITKGRESLSGQRVTVDLKRDTQTAEGGDQRVRVRVEAQEGSGILQWKK